MVNSSSLWKQCSLLLLAPAQKEGDVWSGDFISFNFFLAYRNLSYERAATSLSHLHRSGSYLRPQCRGIWEEHQWPHRGSPNVGVGGLSWDPRRLVCWAELEEILCCREWVLRHTILFPLRKSVWCSPLSQPSMFWFKMETQRRGKNLVSSLPYPPKIRT